MRDVFLCSALRTPVGRYGGALAAVRPDDLGAVAIRAVVEQSSVDPAGIDDLLFGCANQAGEDARNVARLALLLAGLPDSVPGATVNRLCASGLEAVVMGARAIALGDAEVIVAGGVESMSRAPYSMPKYVPFPPRGNVTAYDTALGWRYPNPKMEALFPLEGMGETAENLVERYGISREDQDLFAFGSQTRAVESVDGGAFRNEIVPVEIVGRKNKVTVVDEDEGPRRDTSLERLAKLRPVFRKGGTVTAGNSSTLNDGAAALVLASEDGLKRMDCKPLARFVASGVAGVDPRVMGIGPVPATKKALARAGMTLDQVVHVELNEAFAAQSLAVVRELEVDPEIVNPLGGAIALGHPLGCTGARILTTLLHALQARGGGIGLATLCVGVGQGLAVLVEA